MANTISNRDDVIDSREVIERIDELEGDLEAEYEEYKEEAVAQAKEEHDLAMEQVFHEDREEFDEDNCGFMAFDTWLDDIAHDNSAVYQDDAQELIALRGLASDGEGYGEWAYGETLIRESYFIRYAQELAEECDYIKPDVSWPYDCIDWERAADQLRIDYTEVEFDGVTYLMRA